MRHLIIGITINPCLLSICCVSVSLSRSNVPIFPACVLRVIPSPKTGWPHSLVRSITLSLLCMHHQNYTVYLSDRCTAGSSPALPPVLPEWPAWANCWAEPSWPKPWSALGTGAAYHRLCISRLWECSWLSPVRWSWLLLTDVVQRQPVHYHSLVVTPWALAFKPPMLVFTAS